jgi:uncharacterized phage protein (TIGR01671 family)
LREIKFRCFHKLKNKMYLSEEINHLHLSAFKTHVNCKFMQYTGLKDKNGKEIYDGDILRLILIDYADIPEDIFPIRSEDFHESVCYLRQIISSNSEADSIEIIGNIYENPELLEGDPNGRDASYSI